MQMGKYDELSEKQLVTLLRQGDQLALSKLYYLYVKKLRYYIQRTTQSPFLADDIVHDTFIKVWENREQINPEQEFKAYLFTIAKRQLLNMLKRAQHETTILAEIKKYSTFTERTTDMQLDYNESNLLIAGAVDSLKGQCKEVFTLCRINGLTHKQAGEVLGITESTINKHMIKAIRLIKEHLKLRDAVTVLLGCVAILSK